MGRELKRVPLDFDWPVDKVWHGFLNPFYKHAFDCAHCAGTGSSPEARRMKDQWYGNAPFNPADRGSVPFTPEHPAVRAFAERNVGNSPEYYGRGEVAIAREAHRLAALFNRGWSHHLNAGDVGALIEGSRLMDFTHTWEAGEGWKKKEPAYMPTPEEVNVWSIRGMGHDSINQWIVVGAECKRLGLAAECAHCSGAGQHWNPPEAEKQADEWERSEPPTGDGYQMWETVSEGSAISPVFTAPEDLAEWLSKNRADSIDRDTTAAQWLKFILGPGWAPSLIVDASGVHSGVEAAQ